LEGDAPAAVAKLKEGEGGPILVAGSCTLVHTLLEHGLAGEYRVMIFPVILGSGLRLFPETPDKTTLTLADTRVFDTGVVVHAYRPSGA
jgi:dihydrofolate reductase